ncbi:hypothetical protein PSOLE_14140 [Pseudomonas oleovorans subsp. oleovorans]|uniref:Uncharacterized protein n=1 Tax=Ectopseudomonas oleovorans TaxID=301 RepID=A0A379JMU7_ECTOL|nr:hypothetical protein PSOLE_14140 [Pseudomonas oleovorans subsp. oleovorans]SEK02767.1 hypothetical protein SAMN05216280_11081 [Pseudomonas oleovorans]SUD49686.1 Uncharacterised protein [Pseudomonas oleovorans]
MPSKIASVRMLAWRLMALSNLFVQMPCDNIAYEARHTQGYEYAP